MKLVKHLLDSKGRHVFSVTPDDTVLEAVKLMADAGVGSLVVLDDEKLCGIITERDYARKVIIKGRASESTKVAEIMGTNVFTTSSDQTVDECMERMTANSIRHLPVIEDNRVIGMISMRDLVQAIISDQQEEIEQLEHYISG